MRSCRTLAAMLLSIMKGRGLLSANTVAQCWRALRQANFDVYIAVFVAVAGALIFVSTAVMMVFGWSAMPFLDQWQNLASIAPDFWSRLFDQHNEHRIVIPRLVFWLDWKLSRETNVVNFAAIFISQCVLAGLMFWVGARLLPKTSVMRLWLAGLVASLLFFAAQFENFVWGFQIQFVGVLAAAAATFLATASLASSASALVVLILGAIAAGMLSSGVLVLPLAFLLACWLRRPWPYLLMVGLGALVMPAAYMHHYQTPGHHSNPLESFQHLHAIALHLLVQFGSPFAHGAVSVVGSIGALGLVLFAVAVFAVARARPQPHVAALVAVCAFVLGAALLTAAGRERFGPEQAMASRYASPMLLFWLALALIGAQRLIARGRQSLVFALSLPLVIVVAAQQPKKIDFGLNWAANRSLGQGGLLAGLRDPKLETTFFDVNKLLQIRSDLARNRTSIFADDWTHWLGGRLSDHTEIVDQGCRGSIFSFSPFADGWHVTGAAMQDQGGPVRRLIMTDENGLVTGYALGGFTARQLQVAQRSGPLYFSGATTTPEQSALRIYGLQTRGGRNVACRINQESSDTRLR